jgi:hypothetical protein
MEVVKSMIHDPYLPMHVWEETSGTTVYVKNKSPHHVLRNETPGEIFTSEKTKFIHLRVFGCPVYVHVPKEKRLKLDPLRNKGIFFGYSET